MGATHVWGTPLSSVSPHCVRVTDPLLAGAMSVREWFDYLIASGINFHPDDAPDEIITFDEAEARGREVMYLGKPHTERRRWFLYDDRTAQRMENCMVQAHEICRSADVDIYGLACAAMDANLTRRKELLGS